MKGTTLSKGERITAPESSLEKRKIKEMLILKIGGDKAI